MNRVLREPLGQRCAVGRHHARSNVSVTTSTITTSSASAWPSVAVESPFAGDRTQAITPLNRSTNSRRVSASAVTAEPPLAPVGNSSWIKTMTHSTEATDR
jgi:hypothetical protein